MDKISLPELKKELKTYSPSELISIIVDCYKQSEDVKKYIHMMLNPEGSTEQLYKEAKAKIEEEFYPKRGMGKLRLAQAKKAISEFSKLCKDEMKTIDLMICYVEYGVRFTNDFGDISGPFYSSLASVYENALNQIRSQDGEGLYMMFRDRLSAIVKDTRDIGWGFHDHLADVYAEFEAEYEEWHEIEHEEDERADS